MSKLPPNDFGPFADAALQTRLEDLDAASARNASQSPSAMVTHVQSLILIELVQQVAKLNNLLERTINRPAS